jgi:hypothetical protein
MSLAAESGVAARAEALATERVECSRLESALYEGWVRHRRTSPVTRTFTYPLFMVLLDLGELDQVFAGRWAWSTRRPALGWFRRADYLGDPARPLDACARDLVEESLGFRPSGSVRLLTHLRMFGVAFNPVSFYYCHDREPDSARQRLVAVIAEVHNTPWNERHCYVLDGREGMGVVAEVRKAFHVSPFIGMEVRHRFRLTPPGDHLLAHIEDHAPDGRFFDATLHLDRIPITGSTLAGVLVRHPFSTLLVLVRIYMQAVRLLLARVPYHPHPRDRRSK